MDVKAVYELVRILVSIEKMQHSIRSGDFSLGVSGESGEGTVCLAGETGLYFGQKLDELLDEYRQTVENTVKQYVRPELVRDR